MNPLTRIVAGLFAALVAVVSFVFFATLGVVLVGILAVVLFVGALALRGKGQETRMGSFRVVTFGVPDPAKQKSTENKPQSRSAIGDFVDISPEDYHETSSKQNDKK